MDINVFIQRLLALFISVIFYVFKPFYSLLNFFTSMRNSRYHCVSYTSLQYTVAYTHRPSATYLY